MASTACETTDGAAGGWPRLTFGLTILLSAFLLFQVQPLVSKAILPWFGGCPAVWTTCLLFFQTLLFAGYLYAHLSQRWLSTRGQIVVHLAFAVVALAMLPILPNPNLKPSDNAYPTWRILVLLFSSVGLPYFALSATSPLVQAWFSRSWPGRSPYRLYSLSNIGSLAALLSYPFVFEPAFDLWKQSALWSAAFVAYAALCAALLRCLWRSSDRSVLEEMPEDWDEHDTAVTWPDRLRWLALPALASLMLLAATNHICQDVAVVPFLWVMPLSLYLLSFIITFDHSRWYARWLWSPVAVLALVGVACNDYLKRTSSPLSLTQELALNLTALFAICMVCHGELVRLKPRPRHLTEFYLLIAAGGALGGLLVAVVAPHLFSTYLEWPIGMALSALLALGLLVMPGATLRARMIRSALLLPLAIPALFFLVRFEFDTSPAVDRARNFFGAISVTEYPIDDSDVKELVLMNGRITHGREFSDIGRRDWPTSYYSEQSGVGRAIEYLHRSGPIRVGVVGLGVGTIAAYARPGDVFRFYEINPEVLRMAREHFYFLADCRGECDVVLGDARLSLEAEPSQRFDLLVLDAFNGDAIPTHLLTREAFEVYERHLAPDGIVAIDISNNYLRLAPVLYRLAKHFKMGCTRLTLRGDADRLLDANEWMLLTHNDRFLQVTPPNPPRFDDEDEIVPLWTDQYSNLFEILVPASSKPVFDWFRKLWVKVVPERWQQSNSKPRS